MNREALSREIEKLIRERSAAARIGGPAKDTPMEWIIRFAEHNALRMRERLVMQECPLCASGLVPVNDEEGFLWHPEHLVKCRAAGIRSLEPELEMPPEEPEPKSKSQAKRFAAQRGE